jgi:toxin ParE1/3/4
MAGYRFAERAAVDLDEIWVSIAVDNMDAADQVTDQIHATAKLLAANALMGPSPELLADLRSFPTKTPYIIFYSPEPSGEGVVIVRVLHHARDVDAMFALDSEVGGH